MDPPVDEGKADQLRVLVQIRIQVLHALLGKGGEEAVDLLPLRPLQGQHFLGTMYGLRCALGAGAALPGSGAAVQQLLHPKAPQHHNGQGGRQRQALPPAKGMFAFFHCNYLLFRAVTRFDPAFGGQGAMLVLIQAH